MSNKPSKNRILEAMQALLSSEEGMLTLLAAGLVISDFDDPKVALEEAIKAYQGNQGYFQLLMERSRQEAKSD